MAIILVADDEPMIRDLVTVLLKAAGHEVMTAANGLEAVALYRSYQNRIALVITDIRMPVMDGNQVVKLVRESRPDAKIICMTGQAEAVPEGVPVIQKPFQMDEFRKCVETALAPAGDRI